MIANMILFASICSLIFAVLGWFGLLDYVVDWYEEKKYQKRCVICKGEQPACWIPWKWDGYWNGIIVMHPNVCQKHINQIHHIGALERELFGDDVYN